MELEARLTEFAVYWERLGEAGRTELVDPDRGRWYITQGVLQCLTRRRRWYVAKNVVARVASGAASKI